MNLDLSLRLDALDKRILGLDFQRAESRDRATPAVFNLGLHEWGNIGDLAINVAETLMLEKIFRPGHQVFSYTRSTLAANWQRIQTIIGPEDLIVIHGGGNLGDIWPHEEAARLAIVNTFVKNRIISLPQSIHFSDPAKARASARTYQRHPALTIALRDDESYDRALRTFPGVHCVRAEDSATRIVLPFPFNPERSDFTFIERADAERRPHDSLPRLRAELDSDGFVTKVTDTVVHSLPFSNREIASKLVYNTIDELHGTGVVLTNRLHGAVFALIAGRPVIVSENSYGKIMPALKNLQTQIPTSIYNAEAFTRSEVVALARDLRNRPHTLATPAAVLRSEHDQFDDFIFRTSGFNGSM